MMGVIAQSSLGAKSTRAPQRGRGGKMENRIDGEYDENWIVFKKNCGEIWGQNISTHTWKDRSYSAILIGKISLEEATLKVAEYKREREAEALARKKEKDKQDARAEWVKGLAGKKFHNLEIDSFGNVVDKIGNILFSLPRNPIDNVESWIKTQLDHLLEFYE